VSLPPGITGLTNVFRVGELVWYKHSLWRLGVIVSIAPKFGAPVTSGPSSDANYNFTLAPLGHALLPQGTHTKESQDLRPFLTFSVPPTHPQMDADLKDKTFDTVDWQGLVLRAAQAPDPPYTLPNVGLEASKMGARAVNDCFSTFNLVHVHDESSVDGTVRHERYNGVYLGAEMICVGDPIRVTPTTPTASPFPPVPQGATLVMLIHEIVVLTRLSQPGAPHEPPTLQFRGNIFYMVRSGTQSLPENVVTPEALGPAFVEEVATRNALQRDKTMAWWWVQYAPGQPHVRGEQDVLGRFYVSEKLMNIIEPGRYQGWVQRNQLEEPPAYLNNRNHSGAGQFVGRRPGRAASLGQVVSVQFVPPPGMVEN
jgi:hypothetical protein